MVFHLDRFAPRVVLVSRGHHTVVHALIDLGPKGSDLDQVGASLLWSESQGPLQEQHAFRLGTVSLPASSST